jgi:hypothetical protein
MPALRELISRGLAGAYKQVLSHNPGDAADLMHQGQTGIPVTVIQTVAAFAQPVLAAFLFSRPVDLFLVSEPQIPVTDSLTGRAF